MVLLVESQDFLISTDPCSICFEALEVGAILGKKVVLLHPSKEGEVPHAFHAECAERWFKENPSCPLCRSEKVSSSLRKIENWNGVDFLTDIVEKVSSFVSLCTPQSYWH
jgi:hypothetical protein